MKLLYSPEHGFAGLTSPTPEKIDCILADAAGLIGVRGSVI